MEERKHRSVNPRKNIPRSRVVENRLPNELRINRPRILGEKQNCLRSYWDKPKLFAV